MYACLYLPTNIIKMLKFFARIYIHMSNFLFFPNKEGIVMIFGFLRKLKDGIVNVGIKLLFDAIHQGPNDTYLYNYPPAPQIWCCRSTYWSYDNVNGLVWRHYGVPPGYESENDVNLAL